MSNTARLILLTLRKILGAALLIVGVWFAVSPFACLAMLDRPEFPALLATFLQGGLMLFGAYCCFFGLNAPSRIRLPRIRITRRGVLSGFAILAAIALVSVLGYLFYSADLKGVHPVGDVMGREYLVK